MSGGREPTSMPTPFCHGEMVHMAERAAFICMNCGAQADYETVVRAAQGGFRLVRIALPPPPSEAAR